MNYDGADPVLLEDFEKPVAHYPVWRGTPQQDDGVEQATEDEHTEQAIKDCQALPRAELQTHKDQINMLVREKDLRESEEDSAARQLAEKWPYCLLSRLDKSRMEELVQFLVEADMVQILYQNPADLSRVNLSGAHLNNALLHYANLSGANLSGATGVTEQSLERQILPEEGAFGLEGATMPDGSTHP